MTALGRVKMLDDILPSVNPAIPGRPSITDQMRIDAARSHVRGAGIVDKSLPDS
jgi:hypothetical protein